jgi:hypothetical protein
MTQHMALDYQDPVHEGFFDPLQELLGAAVPSLRITVSNPTTLQVTATTDNGQIAVAINGRYRYRTTNTTAALPGSTPDGTHPVYVTATDNDFTQPEPDPDALTDYTFGLAIRRTADGPPASALYRQVGEVDVVAQAITAFRQTAGPRPAAGFPLWAASDHASQVPLVAKGIAGQTANLFEVRNSAGTILFRVSATGEVQVPQTVESLNVLGNTQLGDTGADTVITSGPVTVGGALNANNNLTVLGNTQLGDAVGDTVVTSGPLTANSLTVTNNLTVNGNTQLGNAVGDTVITSGPLTANSLTVTGATGLSSLVVSGNTQLGDAAGDTVSIPGLLTTTGLLTANGGITVVGTTTLQTTNTQALTATSLVVSGNTVLGDAGTDTVTIAGPVTIGGLLTANANLSVPGTSTLGTLSVTGNTTLGDAITDTVSTAGPLTAYSAAVTNNLTVTGATTLGDGTDTTTINGPLVASSTLQVNGNTTLGDAGTDTVTTAGKLTVAGELELDGALNHDGTTVGFYGVTPVARSTGWTTVGNLATVKTFDSNDTTVHQVADALGTLIEALKATGIIGA